MAAPSTPPGSSLPDAQELVDAVDTGIRQDALDREYHIEMLTRALSMCNNSQLKVLKVVAGHMLGFQVITPES